MKSNLLTQFEIWFSKLKAQVKIPFKNIRIRPVKMRPIGTDILIRQHIGFIETKRNKAIPFDRCKNCKSDFSRRQC